MLEEYTYIFVIGTLFALLDAYNNGASKFISHCFFISSLSSFYLL